jgi:hypothetical protein
MKSATVPSHSPEYRELINKINPMTIYQDDEIMEIIFDNQMKHAEENDKLDDDRYQDR